MVTKNTHTHSLSTKIFWVNKSVRFMLVAHRLGLSLISCHESLFFEMFEGFIALVKRVGKCLKRRGIEIRRSKF